MSELTNIATKLLTSAAISKGLDRVSRVESIGALAGLAELANTVHTQLSNATGGQMHLGTGVAALAKRAAEGGLFKDIADKASGARVNFTTVVQNAVGALREQGTVADKAKAVMGSIKGHFTGGSTNASEAMAQSTGVAAAAATKAADGRTA